jgi:hypothetical protein
MLVRMEGLKKRGEVWIYRRVVPLKLRSFLGKRGWKESLDTDDLNVAQQRWGVVHARVNQIFKEAEAGVRSPTIIAYRTLRTWTPGDDRAEEGLDLHLTTLLEREDLDPVRRAAVETLLRRHDLGSQSLAAGNEGDDPPLSVLFDRYHAERKLPGKTKLEWDCVLARFTKTCGDLPVKAITQANVRNFKSVLLATTGRTGKPLSPATVKKTLGALAESCHGPRAKAT